MAWIYIIKDLDFSPLWISLKAGVIATFFCFFAGILCAWYVMKKPGKISALLDAVMTLPMVLPPTVAGFFLLLLFSKRRPLGRFLFENFSIKIVQTFAGCVVAAFVIAFPLMYKNAKASFEQVDENLIYAARTLGMSERKILWKVILPNAFPGVISGTVLTFARAIGEYGATSMLAGNIAGKTGTISQKIAMVLQNGDYTTAGIWVAIILGISLVILLLINIVGWKTKK